MADTNASQPAHSGHDYQDLEREEPQSVLPPTSTLGVAAAALALTTLLTAVTVIVEKTEDILLSLTLSALFSLPFSLVVRAGRLGSRRWKIPTPGAFLLLFWLLGLSPSLVSLSAESRYVARFSDAAVMYGRCSSLAWFVLFALCLGQPSAKKKESADSTRGLAMPFLSLTLFWAFCVTLAARYDRLSYYRGPDELLLPETGGIQRSIIGYYITLTPMMMPLAVWARQRQSRTMQVIGTLLFLAGAAALFVYSSRRLWIVSLYLCVCMASSFGRRPARRLMIVAIAVGLLGAGPLP